jgi:hypothetical protein
VIVFCDRRYLILRPVQSLRRFKSSRFNHSVGGDFHVRNCANVEIKAICLGRHQPIRSSPDLIEVRVVGENRQFVLPSCS